MIQTPARAAILAATLACSSACAATHTDASEASATVTPVRLAATTVDGQRISELSGLAWDRDTALGYAVSDRGVLFHFRLEADAPGEWRVEPVFAAMLRAPDGSELARKGLDAEGLATHNGANGNPGDTELLVATEGQPRVMRFAPDGVRRGEAALPASLSDPTRFRRANAMLEAVVDHPEHGLLVAAESALVGEDESMHRVFAADRGWTFPVHATGARLKAMDVIEDGRLLVLERTRASKGPRMQSTLRIVDIANCAGADICPVDDVAVLEGHADSGNFEGMAYLGEGRVLLVSDDMGRKRGETLFRLVGVDIVGR